MFNTRHIKSVMVLVSAEWVLMTMFITCYRVNSIFWGKFKIVNSAMPKRITGEGPSFCCRRGKVKIHIPSVPDELRRLFTSQSEGDAIFFWKNIRYYNSHFSFTSLGANLDRRYVSAAGTSIYTFQVQGQVYHKLDTLSHGEYGPRHMQLYFYDTYDNVEHRIKRSPHLDKGLIRKILDLKSY